MSEVVVGGERRELKHLSTCRKINHRRDCLSSGERTGNSLNRSYVKRVGVVGWVL